jgi:hypothetical protein
MTVLALVLLALAAVAPGLRFVLRRELDDPTLLVAGLTAVLLATAAWVAAYTDGTDGWRAASALVLGVAVATTGGSDIVRATFRLMRGELDVRRLPPPAQQSEAAEPATEQMEQPRAGAETVLPAGAELVLRGGAMIGYLERAAISATLLAGWPEGIALALAVKGVGRYPELRGPASAESNAPEAFIIGTLASVLWAAAAAGTAWLLR